MSWTVFWIVNVSVSCALAILLYLPYWLKEREQARQDAQLPFQLEQTRQELNTLRSDVMALPGDTAAMRRCLDQATEDWTACHYSHSVGDLFNARRQVSSVEDWLKSIRRDLHRATIAAENGWHRLSKARVASQQGRDRRTQIKVKVEPSVADQPGPLAVEDPEEGLEGHDALEWMELSEVEKNRIYRQRTQEKSSRAKDKE